MPTRILLIEDDEDNAIIMRARLARCGLTEPCTVEWASDLSAGLSLLSAHAYDLVLLDLTLPESDGLETIEYVRQHTRDAAIVALTGNEDPQIVERAIQKGAQDFLLKRELNDALLTRTLRYALDRQRAELALRQAQNLLEAQVRERTRELQTALARSQENERALLRQHDELTALHALTAAVSATLDAREVAATLTALLSEQLGVPGGNLFFYDGARDELILQATWGMPAEITAQCARIPVSRCHAEVVAERQARHWEDFREVQHLQGLRLSEARPDWQSYLSVPLVALGEVRGALDLFSAAPRVFTEADLPFFVALGQQVGVAIRNAGNFAAEQAARRASEHLSRLIVEAQENERRRLARELHDELGQMLTGLKLTLETAPGTAPQLEQARQIVRELGSHVRELSHTLRPAALDDLGLVPALLAHCARFTERTGVHVSFQHNALDNRRFAPELETAAYRIVQEALTNVARHAGVAQANVHVAATRDRLRLQISDSGCGFTTDKALPPGSNGLRGMRERALLLGGKLRIDAESGVGTSITASFPLSASTATPPDAARNAEETAAGLVTPMLKGATTVAAVAAVTVGS